MPPTPSSLSSALTALGDSIAGLGTGLKSIADKASSAQSTAQSAQDTADAAIPQSQVGTAPGDVVVLDESGRLPAVDASQLVNLPAAHATLPALTIELGHSQQASGGRGIDMGDWYQLDFRIGVTTNNNFQCTTNEDGTISIESGLYLVSGSAKIIAPSTDMYELPAQIYFAVGQGYAYPGIYQYAVQRYPDAPIGNASVSGVVGSLGMSGVQANWGGNELWMGFAKVLGSQNQTPLTLQGYMSIVKIG